MSQTFPAASAFSQQTGPAIQLEDIRLSLNSPAGPVNILRGISISIAPGLAVGMVGPSGSGKSSLLSVMAGLERPTSGRVQLAGTDLSTLDENGLAHFRRGRVGIVFQSFHLIPTMTALENVAVPMEIAGLPDAFDRAAAELAMVGLAARGHHYPSQMSGGEQQRVALARAWAPRPEILFADEPTGNLDGATGEQIIELLFSRLGQTTLVLVTHDAALAQRCGRVIGLRDGSVVSDE